MALSLWLQGWRHTPGNLDARKLERMSPIERHNAVLLTGEPGSGKTTGAHMCAARHLYAVVDINASAPRGLDNGEVRNSYSRSPATDDPRAARRRAASSSTTPPSTTGGSQSSAAGERADNGCRASSSTSSRGCWASTAAWTAPSLRAASPRSRRSSSGHGYVGLASGVPCGCSSPSHLRSGAGNLHRPGRGRTAPHTARPGGLPPAPAPVSATTARVAHPLSDRDLPPRLLAGTARSWLSTVAFRQGVPPAGSAGDAFFLRSGRDVRHALDTLAFWAGGHRGAARGVWEQRARDVSCPPSVVGTMLLAADALHRPLDARIALQAQHPAPLAAFVHVRRSPLPPVGYTRSPPAQSTTTCAAFRSRPNTTPRPAASWSTWRSPCSTRRRAASRPPTSLTLAVPSASPLPLYCLLQPARRSQTRLP